MRKEYDFSKGQRGAVVTPAAKTRITIMLDDEVIKFFRARAASLNMGYQTTINAALRSVIMNEAGNDPGDRVITVATLREILREELHAS